MAGRAAASLEKVHDSDLADWLARENGELREILVDAVLPRRSVTFGETEGRRARPVGIEEALPANGRRETLRQLRAVLEKILDTPPVVLEAAGALAIRATSRQVRKFVDHPLVKSVRPNRRLRTSA